MTFIANIKETFGAVDETKRDSGDLVSTIIIIAGMAVAAILTINWLSTAVLNSAADAASCIEGSTSGFFAGESGGCDENPSHSEGGNSFSDRGDYTTRF